MSAGSRGHEKCSLRSMLEPGISDIACCPGANVVPPSVPVPVARSHKPVTPVPQQRVDPVDTGNAAAAVSATTATVGNLSPEDFAQAEKFCRYATSALQYQDAETAVKYLRDCLELLSKEAK